jgi:ComF family protein
LPISRPGTCPACKASRPPYQQLRSWSIFEGPIRQGLHDLKYRNNLVLGDVFGKLMADYALSLGWPVERVVPVPVSKARWMERGYNQAAEIALPLAALCAWPYDPSALVRVRESRSQVGLSAAERKENVRDAFRGEPARLNGKRILVLDDVSTTGATLRSAAEACLKAGAREVYALTLARALPRHGLESV